MIDFNSDAPVIDLNHGSGPLGSKRPIDVTEGVNGAIDLGLAAEAAATPPRRYLGASMLGDPCLRKLVYHFRSSGETGPRREPEGRMRRIWGRGHAAEDRLIQWLRGAGFVIFDRTATGSQIGFSQADGQIAGHIDGVVTAGPVLLPYPMLLELKCLNARSWNDLRKKGLAVSKEVYNSQVHLYMAYLELDHCLFGAENADTCELWWNVIPYDQVEAQRVSDRAVSVLRSGSGPLPRRISSTRDHWWCRMCDFSDICWKDES